MQPKIQTVTAANHVDRRLTANDMYAGAKLAQAPNRSC